MCGSHQKIARAGILLYLPFLFTGKEVPAPTPSCSRSAFWSKGSRADLHDEYAAAMLTKLQHDCKHHRRLDPSKSVSAFPFTLMCVSFATTQGYEATRTDTCSSHISKSTPSLLISQSSLFVLKKLRFILGPCFCSLWCGSRLFLMLWYDSMSKT